MIFKRIVIRIFQPKISRKIRILQPGPGKHHSFKKQKTKQKTSKQIKKCKQWGLEED